VRAPDVATTEWGEPIWFCILSQDAGRWIVEHFEEATTWQWLGGRLFGVARMRAGHVVEEIFQAGWVIE
jgi:hypothetical protein